MILESTADIQIRSMRPDDVESICWESEDGSKDSREYLKRQIENQSQGNSLALLALYKGKPAGYVFLYYRCKWGGLGNQGFPGIVDLIVFKKYRNKGIGGQLMAAAEKEASRVSSRVYLDVCLNSEYGQAQRLYAKLGYIPDGKGVYYKEKVLAANAPCINDDELTLCLIKKL